MSFKEIKCDHCGEEYTSCENGNNNEYYYELEEWLFVTGKCSKCNKNVCKDCIRICYTCSNEGQETAEICKKCNSKQYKKVKCDHHVWYVCKEHKKETCGTCRANENYAGKMGGW